MTQEVQRGAERAFATNIYIGHAKTHLQHLMSATIMNVMRMLRWLAEELKAKTSCSTFAQLYQMTA
jgi:hypothetical protein